MRRYFLFVTITCFFSSHAQVGINTESPDPKSLLDIYATPTKTGGLLLPRLSTSEMNNLEIGGLSPGMIIFNTDLGRFLGWDGSKWQNLGYEENNTVPQISGVTLVGNFENGQTIQAFYSFSDAQSDPNDASFFDFQSADDTFGANMNVLYSGVSAGTSGNDSYTLTDAEDNKYIRYCITPGSSSGASPGATVCSDWEGPSGVAPVNLAIWDFAGLSGNEASDIADILDVNVSSAVISRGIGINPDGNADRFNANSFTQPTLADAIANGDYFEFSVTPNNTIVTISSIEFNFERSGAGPTEAVLRSSADGFTTDLATYSGLPISTNQLVTLSSINNISGAITFRLYLFGNTNTNGSGGFEGTGNDLIISGIAN